MIERCFVCDWVRGNGTAREKAALHLNLLVLVASFELERTKSMVAIHPEGEIPQVYPRRNRSNV